MAVLVTGAKGMLGQDLCPILEDAGYEVFETGKEELDVTDKTAVDAFVNEHKPEIIIHCAAYTNVDQAEEEFDKAVLLNSTSTENLAIAAQKNNALLVYISTDYVFDGKQNTPYTVDDKPNPINKYGLSKLMGEEAVKKHCEKYYIVRTSWLFGHHGKNFVETMLSLKNRDEIKVVNDQVGCPTWTVELAGKIVELFDKPYGIYNICGCGPVSWYEFAREIFKQVGIEANLKPCTTAEYPCKAKRPSYSVLENNGSCRSWKAALREYLNLRIEE